MADSITTTLVLEQAQYLQRMRQVADATKELGRVTDEVKAKAARFAVGEQFGRLGDATSRLVGTLAPLALGVGVVSYQAFKAYGNFQNMHLELNGLLGSAAKGDAAFAFIRKLAGPSVFSFQELGEASALLASFGLDVQTYLPTVNALGTVFGQSSQKMMEMVSILGRLKGGATSVLTSPHEGLARFGISMGELEGAGLKFDRDRHYLGTVDQALEAVRNLIQTKFGKTVEEMQASPAAKLASLGDATQRAMADIGGGIAQSLLPAIERLTAQADKLGSSGQLVQWGRRLGTVAAFAADHWQQLAMGFAAFKAAQITGEVAQVVRALLGLRAAYLGVQAAQAGAGAGGGAAALASAAAGPGLFSPRVAAVNALQGAYQSPYAAGQAAEEAAHVYSLRSAVAAETQFSANMARAGSAVDKFAATAGGKALLGGITLAAAAATIYITGKVVYGTAQAIGASYGDAIAANRLTPLHNMQKELMGLQGNAHRTPEETLRLLSLQREIHDERKRLGLPADRAEALHARALLMAGNASGANGGGLLSGVKTAAEKTAQNTGQIVENTQNVGELLRRWVIGGGELGAKGVTATELAGVAGGVGGRGGGTVEIVVRGGSFEEMLTNAFQDYDNSRRQQYGAA